MCTDVLNEPEQLTVLNHPNFHGTPHIGAATYEAQSRIGPRQPI